MAHKGFWRITSQLAGICLIAACPAEATAAHGFDKPWSRSLRNVPYMILIRAASYVPHEVAYYYRPDCRLQREQHRFRLGGGLP